MLLLNGESRHCVDVSDRGFQYGDGVFETIEVVSGKPLFFNRHLRRLIKGCQALLIPPPDALQLEQETVQVSSSADHAVLKLIVTRGSGGRGYRQPEHISPTRLLSLHPYPDYPQHFQTDGIVARVCRQRLAVGSTLAGLKHMNRLEQILARAEWRDDSIQEGLMLDNDGHVIEGTMSNLFLVRDEILYTPEVTRCGVAGIVREMVIEFARRNNLHCVEGVIDMEALLQADEVFVTNSVIGLWPVTRLEQQYYRVGPVTKVLQAAYAEARMVEGAA